jgi:hypothetical protein
MGSSSSKQTKEVRQQRNNAINDGTLNAQQQLDAQLNAEAECMVHNAQRSGNNQPIITQKQREYMQAKNVINNVKKQQLERKQDNFTKKDLIAILVCINNESDFNAMKYDEMTCGELRAMTRQMVYNPQFRSKIQSNNLNQNQIHNANDWNHVNPPQQSQQPRLQNQSNINQNTALVSIQQTQQPSTALELFIR